MVTTPDLRKATPLDIVYSVFNNCTILTVTITIHANPTRYATFLYQTNITAIDGTTTLKDELLADK